jgi:hypothetical protein
MIQQIITICFLVCGTFFAREALAFSVGYYMDARTGTPYSSFLNISDLKFVLVYQLDNTKINRLDLNAKFRNNRKRRIDLN